MPTYKGSAPAFIQKQQDYLKALLLGLFLGNVGVGCPHPATPFILTRIAVSGSIFNGWLLFFVHAIGRVLPLFFLALLAVLGVNGLKWLVARKDKIERATGWGMVVVAAFILVLGLFTHDWWVYSGQHTLLESVTQEDKYLSIIIKNFSLGGAAHHHDIPAGTGLFGFPLWLGNWVLVGLWILPFWWYYGKKKKTVQALADTDAEKKIEQRIMPWRLWLFWSLTALLGITFIWVLPDLFLYHQSHTHTSMMAVHTDTTNVTTPPPGMMMPNGTMMATGPVMLHGIGDVREGIAVDLLPQSTTTPIIAGTSTKLDFFVNTKPHGTPILPDQLDVVHEKLIHVLGIRDDMNEFFHIHPVPLLVDMCPLIAKEENRKNNDSFSASTTLSQWCGAHPEPVATSGIFTVAHIFDKPGKYKIWSEVSQNGTDHIFGQTPIDVGGVGERSAKQVSFDRETEVSGYHVAFAVPPIVVKGENTALSFDIHTDSGEAELENYLGVPMHLSIIKDDLKQFIHTHPEMPGHTHADAGGIISVAHAHGDEEQAPAVGAMGTDHGVQFSVNFPEAGLYKAFGQFRPKGINLPPDETLTASFWIKVDATRPPAIPKSALAIISIILIILLSLKVKKYLEQG